MQTFTGYEYLLIDAANHFGLDKEIFEERIKWTAANLDKLEDHIDSADEAALFATTVMAIRKAQQGKPSGHMVGFDSVCSGMQIMSALTGCESGAEATGLINPNERADAYTKLTQFMRKFIPTLPDSERSKVNISWRRNEIVVVGLRLLQACLLGSELSVSDCQISGCLLLCFRKLGDTSITDNTTGKHQTFHVVIG
jgi:hypothetical protein